MNVVLFLIQTLGEFFTNWVNLIPVPFIGDLFIFDGLDFVLSAAMALLGN
ncbi:MAG: hypothetical protein HUU22_05125 [Phycisphaerae bacterium]|nr:hypothetical protein [Phycisphaerae bacterium]NUQ45395.1 hypothetical protein [Phycisphaerae bacterium]